jgi:hypothetical protein
MSEPKSHKRQQPSLEPDQLEKKACVATKEKKKLDRYQAFILDNKF